MPPPAALFLGILLIGAAAYVLFALLNLGLRALGAPLGMRLVLFLPAGVIAIVISSQAHVPRPRRLAWLIIGLAAFFRAGVELYRRRGKPGQIR